MRGVGSWLQGAVLALIVVAISGPPAVAVLHALVTPVVVLALAAAVLRLVWFWTSL